MSSNTLTAIILGTTMLATSVAAGESDTSSEVGLIQCIVVWIDADIPSSQAVELASATVVARCSQFA